MSRDLIIVGAGPAGVSAALWAREFGLAALLIEGGPSPGGQLHHVYFSPRDIAGVRAVDGRAIARVYAQQLSEAGVSLRHDCVARALESPGEGVPEPGVSLCTGETLSAAAVLIATGARRRRLDVPGEREFEGRGVSYSATLDRERFAGLPIAVVGGGDAAFENALMLAQAGCEVALVVRGTVRARPTFRARVGRESHIHVHEKLRVTAIFGDEVLRGLRVTGPGGEAELRCAGVVIKAGVVPNSESCRDVLAHDPAGYLEVDPQHATSLPGIWAAGDVTRPLLMSIPVAVSQGAEAVAVIRTALQGR